MCHNEMTTTYQQAMVGYLTHGVCVGGEAVVRFNGQEMVLRKNDSFILRRSEMGEMIRHSDDFRVRLVFVITEFIELATPLSNYGMRGGMLLFQNPVMPLTDSQTRQLLDSMDYIERCAGMRGHLFYRDLLLNAVQRMIIDFFDFHAALYGDDEITQPAAVLMNGFLALLEQGTFREHRDIGFYAERLNVSGKHLSETVKRYTDFPAAHWINRYTALELSRILRRNDLTLTEIADQYGFASVSHLNRFIRTNLGVNPTELRK